jgi:putative ABC transport system permease protein
VTVHPILAALRRHKAGVVLIVLQIALTLAIVCNAVFIIHSRIERLSRPTGIDENNLIRIAQAWVGAPSGDDAASIEKLDALQRTDLDTLRSLPGVQEVAASESLPLQGMIWSGDVALTPDEKGRVVQAAYYFGDEHLRSTLGVHLIAGRDFNAGDIRHHTLRSTEPTPVIIVSKPVADELFPQGDALGKTVYQDGKGQPSTIVGIVEQLQTPTTDSWGNPFAYNSVLEPVRLDGTAASYAVRAQPGREQAVMREARKALFAVNPMRIMPDSWGTQPFSEIRAKAYRADRGMAILMGSVCLILLGVTAAGIVGLTSFWVGQRHRQIGVRRALGARRIDILHYFQIENLLIAGVGVLLGVLLAVGLNLWLMTHYEMERLPVLYVLTGMLAMLAIGQGAVFVPARRASNVPPVVATRAA